MKRLRTALQDYLAQRRASGVKLRSAGHALLRFICFMEKRKCSYITTALAVEWSMQGSRAKSQDLAQAQCLGVVREFAKYMATIDPRTEIPPYGVLPHPTKHTQPKKKRSKAMGMTTSQSAHELGQAINDYLAMRRALGFKLRLCGNALLDFSSFMQERNAEYVTIKLALEWAQQRATSKPSTWAQRLGYVRDFAKFRIATDLRTEIPTWDLLPCVSQRARPYLYSEEEIRALLDATSTLPVNSAAGVLRRKTYYCLIGLLSVSGMRISEAVNLKMSDVDLDTGVLTVTDGKFGKSRFVPVHCSTQKVLSNYKSTRDEYLGMRGFSSEYFFVTHFGGRIDTADVRRKFYSMSKSVGLRNEGPNRGPRIHDLRHRYAVTTLLQWYRDGEDVERKLPLLSTYLGHVKVKDTYWYLTACPELMGHAVRLLEQQWEKTNDET
ncbi:tyrosine-type recombinase/integrase [Candidatus Obscuribacterales bacterium]|nr:tyrosine-type recombinase/integrase [Candidatus Obscuribacterales bacterium]